VQDPIDRAFRRHHSIPAKPRPPPQRPVPPSGGDTACLKTCQFPCSRACRNGRVYIDAWRDGDNVIRMHGDLDAPQPIWMRRLFEQRDYQRLVRSAGSSDSLGSWPTR
jgi:hypothetical protein